ncbi:MAG: hypothetical protein H6974_08375 [Gammaproteobacteria bacterium]|nr:hypothetical protein [Gammaproteobacteria bacterium]MCP5196783.1 hypothetical protein [Gammaproteobacteria bacterium]
MTETFVPSFGALGLGEVTLQLHYLQTLNDIDVYNNTTVVFPAPPDLIEPLLDMK